MLRAHRRKLRIALVVALLAAAIAVLAFLRGRSAPETARLLPEADAVFYVNVHLVRLGKIFERAAPVSQDPDYQQFVEATGFQFERDLDQAAFAMHAAGSALNPGSASASLLENARFSEVFTGHFNAARVSAYLHKLATSEDDYRNIHIYSIPHEGRTVRVAILGVGTVAVSNVTDVAAIREMIDKYRAAAVPLSPPTLIREYYRTVPIGSVAWAMIQVAPSSSGGLRLPNGLELGANSLAGSVVVASARYLGSIQLRVDDFTGSEQAAKNLMETARTFFSVFKGAETSVGGGGTDPDVKALFDSIKLSQEGNRVRLAATVPPGFISKALSGPPAATPEAPPAAEPRSTKPKRDKRK